MANEKQTRQQSSERAQTSSPSAQQGSGTTWSSSGAQNAPERDRSQDASERYGPQGGPPLRSVDPYRRAGAMTQRQGGAEPYYGGYPGPYSLMRRISDEMDRIFDAFGVGRGFGMSTLEPGGVLRRYGDADAAASRWSPHVEVDERDGKLRIAADLPGVRKEDINIQIDHDAVTLQGQREQERRSEERGYFRSERSYGSFYRVIPLPEGANADAATASFRDGVLEIDVPVTRRARGRKLEIADTGSGSKGGERISTSGTGRMSGSGESSGFETMP